MEIADGLETGRFQKRARIAVIGIGSEHGEQTVFAGARWRHKKTALMLRTLVRRRRRIEDGLRPRTADEAVRVMETLLDAGEVG